MMNDLKLKVDFLNNAVKDTQELIRFIDTKLTIAIAIVGAFLGVLLSTIEKIVAYDYGYSIPFWGSLFLFSISLIVCIIVIIRIIIPTSNPNENIDFTNVTLPDLKFYLAENKYHSKFFCFYNSTKHSLKEPMETYLAVLNASNEQEIVNSLACEKLKLNYIRNVKTDRLRLLIYFLIVTTALFILYYLFFSIETQNIIRGVALRKGTISSQ